MFGRSVFGWLPWAPGVSKKNFSLTIYSPLVALSSFFYLYLNYQKKRILGFPLLRLCNSKILFLGTKRHIKTYQQSKFRVNISKDESCRLLARSNIKGFPEPTLEYSLWNSQFSCPTHSLKISAQYLKQLVLQTASKFWPNSTFCPPQANQVAAQGPKGQKIVVQGLQKCENC